MADRISFTLHELVATIDAFADARLRSGYGISIGDFIYLATIADQQPIDLTSLARCLMVTKAAVSKRMPHLAEAGWIRTSNGPGRRILVGLTDAGASLVERAGGELDGEFMNLFDDPRLIDTGVDRAVLARQLEVLTELVQEKETP